MPADVAKSHDLLGRELSFLNTKWNDYKTLYCTDDDTVQLLNYAASFFFQILREVLRDDIILALCRITDRPESTVRGMTKKQSDDRISHFDHPRRGRHFETNAQESASYHQGPLREIP
jgi:hypothetical protein